MRLFDRLFGLEEINGGEVCPTYLYRWTLLKTRLFSVYLHHFIGDDWSRDMHDHPKRFWSIGIWGRYIEETPIPNLSNPPNCELKREREFRAPWFRSFPAEHIHRIRLEPGRTAWTIVIVGKPVRPWGFWHRGVWWPWKQYVRSETASEMRSCD